ncbi:hypothetical protein LBMAG53_06800 [Planctomycetota bacterium]|nr:hypothetical protein LBMAG53_06800 [Planctomycetota bacterium]
MPDSILVIDDSLTIRKLLELSLTGAGHAVQVAATAAEGLALARRLRPRLILLDHILPDRKGTEVCAELAADPATGTIPVIIMSAKGDDIRPLFRDRPSVVACIGKPFAPAAISHLVAETLRPTPAAAEPRSEPGTASFRPQDPATANAAQVIFTALRDRLALIPTWAAEAAGQPPAAFYARRLLTPEAVSRLLEGVAPLLAGARQPAESVQTSALTSALTSASSADEVLLSGSTAVLDLPALLRLLHGLGRSGVLELGASDRLVELFCERGEVILALPSGAAAEQAAAAAGLVLPAAADDGVPLLVAAVSGLPEGSEQLQRIGIAALLGMVAAGPQPFRWRPRSALPAAMLKVGRAITAEQMALERLRLVDDWTQVEAEVASLDQICSRSPDLAAQLRSLTLNPIEHRILTDVDGRRSVRAIVERSRLSTFEVFHVLYRLIQSKLVLPRSPAATARSVRSPVLCAGPASPLIEPLTRMFIGQGLQPPAVVRDATGVAALGGECLCVVVDADTCDGPAVIRFLRSSVATSAVPVVAVVDRFGDPAALTASGCDAVLFAPVHVSALPPLLGC